MTNKITSLAIIVVLFSLFGCQKVADEPTQTAVNQSSRSVEPLSKVAEPDKKAIPASDFAIPRSKNETDINTASKTPQLQLREGNWDDVLQLIGQSKGKVVVVDIWSLSCAPCLKEFPGLVLLQQEFAEKIVCVGMAADYTGRVTRPPSFYEPQVRAFLTKQQAFFPNFQCNVDSLDLFDSLKIASIPAVFVFDQQGKLVKQFDNRMLQEGDSEAFSYSKDVQPFVSQLINPAAASTKQ